MQKQKSKFALKLSTGKKEIEKLRRVFETAVCERDMIQAQKDFERRKSTCETLGFVKETENMSAVEILNYYRNLYHADPSNTKRGIVANAINDALLTIKRQATEIEKLQEEFLLIFEKNGK